MKNPHDQYTGKIFRTLRCWTRRLLLLRTRSYRIPSSRRRSASRSRKPQKEDWFLRGRQIAFTIYDYFRVTGAHGAVLNYADLFSVTLRDDNIQEFDTRWDEVLLTMTKIPSDEILESLYKLRMRESVQLKTVLDLCDLEIHQKISNPDYQKLKTMVKRSTDQKLRLRNFDARHGKVETGAVGKSRKGAIGVEGGKRNLLPVERKRPVFARRLLQCPPRNPRSCAKTRTHCRHTFRASPFTR